MVQVGNIIGEFAFTPRLQRSKCVNWINPRKGRIAIGPNQDTGDIAAELVNRSKVVIDEYVTHRLDGLESFEKAVDIT